MLSGLIYEGLKKMALRSIPNETKLKELVQQTLKILEFFGLPISERTARRNERMAKAFLAVVGMSPGMKWVDAQSMNEGRHLLSREVLRYMNENLGEQIADSSYDDIRRQDLLYPIEAGIVLKSAANPSANTNNPTRKYALNPEYLDVLRSYGSPLWGHKLKEVCHPYY